MRLVPPCLERKAVSVSVVAALLATILCLLARANANTSASTLLELIDRVSLCNLPLGLCIAAWIVVIADVDSGYSPTRVQLATIILFFGTLCPLALSISSFPLALAVVRRALDAL